MTVEIASSCAEPSPPGGRPRHPAVLRAAQPDPDVRRVLWRLNFWPVRMTSNYSLRDARRDWQLVTTAFASREPIRSVAERTIAGPSGAIRLRIYTPESGSEPRPVLAWFHGGGFIFGDLETADGTCRALANRSGATVVSVEYRLAPEHELEAGREDSLAVVKWIAEHAPEIGGDPTKIAVGGDSAGGTLATAVAHDCARRGGPPLCLQVLVYPATDLASDYPSNRENADGYLLTQERIEWIRGQISRASDLTDSRFSPLRHADLSGLPPALVVTAGFDPIRDEALAYAERLCAAGVPVQSLHYPGQIHGFVGFNRVFDAARDALGRIGSTLAAAFADRSFYRRRDHLENPRDTRHEESQISRSLGQHWKETLVAGLWIYDRLQRRAGSLLTQSWRV